MHLPTRLQGRAFGPEELRQIQALIGQHGQWSRYRLSRELAALWNWRTPRGQLKDMAARTLLLKLQERGWIGLPAPRRKSPTRSGRAPAAARSALDESPLAGVLPELVPLRLREVSGADQREPRRQLEAALHQHHYLGYRSRVGENLQYWVCDRQDRPLGCVVFGAPAWQCAVRDQWIGWSATQRARSLGGIVNNTRFLIFPWVRVPRLASHLLSLVSGRLGQDWQAKYGQPIWLLETFVDRQRFAGTCYRAANWISLGQTRGRGRQGPAGVMSTTIKEVYVRPLHRNFRGPLRGV
ncbi:MAG: Druantia anti-phage system protein DruA [Limisphaerales bacterium]